MTTTTTNGVKTFKNEKYKIDYQYPEGIKTDHEQYSEKLDDVIQQWKEHGVERYTGELSELKTGMKVCYITIDKKVRLGGYLRSNNKETKYFTLFNGKNRVSWSVQYINVTGKSPIGVYLYTDAFEKWEELQAKKQAEAERKEGIRNGTIKRTRRSKNTPELLNAYDAVINYFYYERGYKKSRDNVHRFITDELKEMEDEGSLQAFLKKITMTDLIFNKVPRKEVEDFINKQAIHQLTKKTEVAPDKADGEKEKVLENNTNQHKDDIKIGDVVRLAIEKDKHNIEESAIKWTEELFTVFRIQRPKKNPSNPILYAIKSKADGEKLKGLFKRPELQVIKGGDVENADKLTVKYVVEKLIKAKRNKGILSFLVKWKGYPVAEATWKTARELREEGFQEEVNEALKRLLRLKEKPELK
jgi:hypothetical protein